MKTLEVLEVFSINIVCNKLTLNNFSYKPMLLFLS